MEGVRDAATDDDGAFVVLRLGALLEDLPDALSARPAPNDKARTAEFALPYAFAQEWRYRVVPPPGLRPLPLPPPGTRALGPATLEQRYQADADGVVSASLRFSLDRQRLSAQEVAALRAAVADLLEEGAPVIRFERTGVALLRAGKVREALVEHRRLIALHPSEALHHLHHALALMHVGMGEAARQEARLAVQLEPRSAMAQRILGLTLQHDALGRLRKPGADHAGAVAAYRRALELDDKDHLARADLGLLLLTQPDGEVVWDAARLKEPIALLSAVPKDLDLPVVRTALLEALLRAGRFAELLTQARAQAAAPRRDALLLAGLAAHAGVPAALREAQRLGVERDKQQEALAQAGRDLLSLRRYPEAAALIEVGARGEDETAALLAVLRRAVRHEIEPRDPVLAQARRPLIEGLRKEARDGHLPPAVFIDLNLAMLQLRVEGDAASGHRVIASRDEEPRVFVHLTQGASGPRVVATIGGGVVEIERLGEEALRRAEAGDLAGARRWLDWGLALRERAADSKGLWSARGGETATLEQVRAAAAELMALDPVTAPRALPILQRCRGQALCAAALIRGQLVLGKHAEALAGLDALGEKVPNQEQALQLRASALVGLGRLPELRRFAEEHLRAQPDDRAALRLLAGLLEHAGDYAGADARYRRLLELGAGDATVHNNLAWLQLFLGAVGEPALALARQAVAGGDATGSGGHTLAALYAESGRPLEALEALRGSLNRRGTEPRSDDFYVLGRIAEEYGLPEVAAAAYRKVERRDAADLPLSTYALVQRRAPRVIAAAPR